MNRGPRTSGVPAPPDPGNETPGSGPTEVGRPRRRRRWVVLLLSPLLGLLLVELGLRFLLFNPSGLAREWGASWRHANLFADRELESAYWRLDRALAGNPDDRVPARPHPELGWVSQQIDPQTLAHEDEPSVGARRPVLLFGASFAQCIPKDLGCFEHLMERSDLADGHRLLNYGVGGYGVDQGLLLLRRVLERFEGRDPFVVLAFVLDTDLDRAMLDFRGAPKPRLRWVGGRLLEDPRTFGESAHDALEREGTGITSYAWRAFLGGATFVPEAWRESWSGRARLRAEASELRAALVLTLHQELEERGVPHVFLVLTGPGALRNGGRHSAVRHFERLAARHDLPCVDARLDLLRAEHEGLQVYQTEGRGLNHPSAAGNGVIFEALREGLLGRRDALRDPSER